MKGGSLRMSHFFSPHRGQETNNCMQTPCIKLANTLTGIQYLRDATGYNLNWLLLALFGQYLSFMYHCSSCIESQGCS